MLMLYALCKAWSLMIANRKAVCSVHILRLFMAKGMSVDALKGFE